MVPVNEKTGETVPDADKTGENAQITTILVLSNQYYVCHIHFYPYNMSSHIYYAWYWSLLIIKTETPKLRHLTLFLRSLGLQNCVIWFFFCVIYQLQNCVIWFLRPQNCVIWLSYLVSLLQNCGICSSRITPKLRNLTKLLCFLYPSFY